MSIEPLSMDVFSDTVAPVYRRKGAYQRFPFQIPRIELTLWLDAEVTRVRNRMNVVSTDPAQSWLMLNGEGQHLTGVYLNGQAIHDYQLTPSTLSIAVPPGEFQLTIECEICPQQNLELEGLYVADGVFCSQCEAEGFRKITYYPDRPDVLSVYTVTLHAPIKDCPVLLSNGNRIAAGRQGENQHWATWHDPFAKPCYLFAVVAGQLECNRAQFISGDNLPIDLALYTLPGQSRWGDYALQALQKAMQWDEQTYGLSYDLSTYQILATDFFNVEAMENKGLNIFNSEYVLADPATACDEDYYQIASVIAHEYFHNWTGNRVTVRDWFQLTLKEGLTVFRDQCFSADIFSPITARLEAVKMLLFRQFSEDKGPFGHAPRPAMVRAIDNFYTSTVYEKGAEIIRMAWRLMGDEGFKQGMRDFLRCFDGRGATCEDLLCVLQRHSNRDIGGLIHWFDYQGTPTLVCEMDCDHQRKELQLTVTQISTNETPVLKMPLWIELLHWDHSLGRIVSQPQKLMLDEKKQTWFFPLRGSKPVVAMLCDLSAPVECDMHLNDEQRRMIILGAQDAVVRWLTQQQWAAVILCGLAGNANLSKQRYSLTGYIHTISRLCEQKVAPELLAQMLQLPPAHWLVDRFGGNIVALETARIWLNRCIVAANEHAFKRLLKNAKKACAEGDVQQRALWRVLYKQLLALLFNHFDEKEQGRLIRRCETSQDMNEQLGILDALVVCQPDKALQTLDALQPQWQYASRAMNKWFKLQALCHTKNSIERVSKLLRHAHFDVTNPNRVKALVQTFCEGNPRGFHHPDGRGYALLAKVVLQVDQHNPQLAAALIRPFLTLHNHPDEMAMKMFHQVAYLSQHQLSTELREKVDVVMESHVQS
ncbi:aminopeptidase N [Alteromonas sp. C1M14]|uniref:aminopeptidase N n=1 Tax=Alteromonas sp. C1M14 TaxID=2841567 RepID=UPI001C0817E9|nr:aminopeptidase N [Alteromonas sp. C1M14]MBU2978547.1 aminopeptidase N [Alteromonas sp. C1M14]